MVSAVLGVIGSSLPGAMGVTEGCGGGDGCICGREVGGGVGESELLRGTASWLSQGRLCPANHSRPLLPRMSSANPGEAREQLRP